MKINNNSEINWTEMIKSFSSVRDPLGLWSHLNIQVDYVPGITSVTKRIRYYSLLAWYYDQVFEEKILTPNEFERLFILTCLSHHDGDYSHPALGHVFNKQRFKDNWDKIQTFKLNKKYFPINGFGRTYYNKQLDVFRCCWTNQINETIKSPINHELAKFFPTIDLDFFKKKEYGKEDVKNNLSEFCICNKYEKEIDVMSKLLLGFIKYEENEWKLDDESYNKFIQNGKIDLEFKGFEVNTEETLFSNTSRYTELGQRRRNTLLMFLKIISETNPKNLDLHKSMWDATYFGQNTYSKENIDFIQFQKILKYWELFQLNNYYVYSLEMVFDIIQNIVFRDSGIQRAKVLSSLNKDKIFYELNKLLDIPISDNTDLKTVIKKSYEISKISEGLKSILNESVIYENISKNKNLEVKLVNSLLMLILLKRRFESIDPNIIKQARIEKNVFIKDKLRIDSLFDYIDKNNENSFISFLDYLIQSIIEKHLYEASVRINRGTQNWLFVEEDSRLFFSKEEMISIHTRDNRWDSILSLMKDIEIVEVFNDKIKLTDKGKKWLKV